MKRYTLIDNATSSPVKDEDGDNVSFKVIDKKDRIVSWMDQKCFEMNGCKENGRYYVLIEQIG